MYTCIYYGGTCWVMCGGASITHAMSVYVYRHTIYRHTYAYYVTQIQLFHMYIMWHLYIYGTRDLCICDTRMSHMYIWLFRTQKNWWWRVVICICRIYGCHIYVYFMCRICMTVAYTYIHDEYKWDEAGPFLYIYTCVYKYIDMYMHRDIYLYAYTYRYIYTCMYIYIHIYI